MDLASRIAVGLVALHLGACAPAIQRGVRAGTEGSLEALSDQDNQRRLAALARSSELQDATRMLAASAAQGVVEGTRAGLADVGVEDRLGDFVAGAGERTEALMRHHIAPGAAAILAESIDASLRTVASEENLARTRALVAATTRAAALGAASAVTHGGSHSEVHDEGARHEHRSDADLRHAIGGLAHEISREIVLGSNDALVALERRDDQGTLGGVANILGVGAWVLIALLVAVSVTFVALVVFVFRGSSQRKHLERDMRQREQMLMQLMNAAFGARGAPLDEEQRPRGNERLAPPGVEGA